MKNLYHFLFVNDLLKQPVVAVPVVSLKQQFKKDVGIIILCAYILFLFKPVVPVLADKLAHTFWYEYHMISVHGVLGEGHVNKQVIKAEKQEQKDKTAGNNKTSSEEYFFLPSALPATTYFVTYESKHCSFYKTFYSAISLAVNDKPPASVMLNQPNLLS